MCKIVDEYVNEKLKEVIRNLFMNGGTLEIALKTFTSITEDVISQIYEEVVKARTHAEWRA